MLSLHPEQQQQHQQEDHDEDQQRRRGEPGVVQVLEVVVHEVLEHVDALVGPVASQQIGLPEGLEGVDDGDDEHEEEVGDHQRQGDVPQNVALRGPIAHGGVCIVRGDRAQARQEQDHVISAVLPEVQTDEHQEGQLGVQPVPHGEAQARQELVDHPAPVKERPHYRHHGCHRDHHGHQKGGTEEAGAPEFPVQGQSQQEGKDHQQRHTHADEAEGISRRQAEGSAAQQVGVVPQTHEPGPARSGGEGLLDAPDEGNQVQ